MKYAFIFIYLFIFKFYFIFKLYIIVLVLPNIKMNPPQVSRGMVWGRRREEGSGWGTHVYLKYAFITKVLLSYT